MITNLESLALLADIHSYALDEYGLLLECCPYWIEGQEQKAVSLSLRFYDHNNQIKFESTLENITSFEELKKRLDDLYKTMIHLKTNKENEEDDGN